MKWFKKNLDIVIKVTVIAVTVIGFVLVLDLNIREVQSKQESHIDSYENFRYNEVPETYMRKDVMEQVLIRLDRIEQKIDRQNGN